MKNKPTAKLLVGWREWVSFPQLNLPLINAKIDSGAKTSSLHAINMQEILINNTPHVRFTVHPFMRDKSIARIITLPVIDERRIKSSNGGQEHRMIIHTPLKIGERVIDIELSLTDRRLMTYPLLLGREALKQFALIDVSKAYCQGRYTLLNAKKLYQE